MISGDSSSDGDTCGGVGWNGESGERFLSVAGRCDRAVGDLRLRFVMNDMGWMGCMTRRFDTAYAPDSRSSTASVWQDSSVKYLSAPVLGSRELNISKFSGCLAQIRHSSMIGHDHCEQTKNLSCH